LDLILRSPDLVSCWSSAAPNSTVTRFQNVTNGNEQNR